ncbi:TPA: integrase, partial [Campylobacter jejuni]|nr:integrase [Campylobacter jejuni]
MWISSKEFALKNNIDYFTLAKSVKRAKNKGKKFCYLKPNILGFNYTQGKGRGGKTLQIWSKPLSKEEAQLVEQGFNIEDISNATITPKTTQEVLSKALNDDILLKNSKALQVQNTDKTKLSENQIQINKDNLSLFAKASSKKQNLALQKAAVVKEWLHAKGKISTNDFINYINAKKIYEFKLTQNKLF